MRALILAGVVALAGFSMAQAQQRSQAPADKALSKKIFNAIVQAGLDLRTNSLRVIVTADHTVYLKGLISDANEVQLAVKVAQDNAPSGYTVVNKISGSFFDDPNHNTGGAQDK